MRLVVTNLNIASVLVEFTNQVDGNRRQGLTWYPRLNQTTLNIRSLALRAWHVTTLASVCRARCQ